MAVMILRSGLRTVEQYCPGSTERRQRRLLRLREQTAAMIEAELRQRSVQQEAPTASQSRRRARQRFNLPEWQAFRDIRCGRQSAAVTIGTMTLEAAARVETRETGVQAKLGFTYLPSEPTRMLRLETVPHPGLLSSDHGSHVHLSQKRNGSYQEVLQML